MPQHHQQHQVIEAVILLWSQEPFFSSWLSNFALRLKWIIYDITSDVLITEIKTDVEKQLELFKAAFENVDKADVVTLESVKMDLKTELIKLKSLANLVNNT